MARKRYDPDTPIYQLRIALLNIEPPIWRRFVHQCEELHTALKKLRVPTEFIVYPNTALGKTFKSDDALLTYMYNNKTDSMLLLAIFPYCSRRESDFLVVRDLISRLTAGS